MRRLLTGLLVLTLAGNGIACACPLTPGPGEYAPTHHTEHSSQHAELHEPAPAADSCHDSDCDGDCDAATLAGGQRSLDNGMATPAWPDHEYPPPVDGINSFDDHWRISSATQVRFPAQLPAQTPVTRWDRMQD